MTNWRAVLWGFVAGIVFGLLAFAIPVIGHVGAGLVAGGVAGYLAGGGLASGAWHGLLAGALDGIVLALLVSPVAALLGGLGGGPVGSLVGGLGVVVIGVLVAAVFAIDSAIGGAIGVLFSDERQTTGTTVER
ncbi:hypothetical protein SAMN05216559_4212 [Halomicrobium zhouii]|uniref:DUF5518 domain-containing protein n=1 Tax=Halomicrobium zhouii TaxID=767519 RepID=A0A1I6MC41_9EURY|nr:DUF5518 domain-containing protein [Halomicrobium zhouii]SFS13162.1 hypothetical protein SAMN05216559_4212 [Halomicrobium zhouii]